MAFSGEDVAFLMCRQMGDIMSIVRERAVTGSQWNYISLLVLSGVHLK